jgi:type 1 fimbriae regulatory protein FimB/type 1 fimbriae regulatory protein FimE
VVAKLGEAAKGNRWGHRDATMILVAYRHGLRASELVDLWWDQVDFAHGTLAVRRELLIQSVGMSCEPCDG